MTLPAKNTLDLIKILDKRVKPASEHFAANPARIRRGAPPLEELIPVAERLGTAETGCYRVETRCALTSSRSRKGFMCPAEPYEVTDIGQALSILARDPTWTSVDVSKIAFIDTETTFPPDGTGVCAFLIGVGQFERVGFRVRQYFMTDFQNKAAMIDAASAELAKADAVVSYNGKCFDLPLMESRWRLHGRNPEFPSLHLDLLFPARRLWRGRFADCRLSTIESEVLNILRVSDVPGSFIPGIYLEFLRGLGCERMPSVLDHHAQDIYSLGALLMAMACAVTNPEDARFSHAIEQMGLSRIFHAAGAHENSITALERAIVAARDEHMAYRLSMHLARALRRVGRETEAIEIWKARAESATADRLEPLIELAKYAEHRLKDIHEARRWTERAIAIAQSQSENRGCVTDLERRLSRLQKRADSA